MKAVVLEEQGVINVREVPLGCAVPTCIITRMVAWVNMWWSSR